jgi:tonB-linked outer membrane protein, susC/ragA family
MILCICALAVALPWGGETLAQTKSSVTGVVTESTGAPLLGATVIVKGTNTGTTTDADGRYTLQAAADAVLQFSYLGMQSIEVPVSGRTQVNATLANDDTAIEQVVVTAMGIKRESRAVSYNVQIVDPDQVFAAKDANFMNNLAGKIAGVEINTSSTGVGGETKVVMRGTKSIANGNNALYVLDGIPLPELSLTTPGDAFSIYNGSAVSGDGISNLNPEDFESMTVLTGPSAAALYGAKAANGVVMLTSRKGDKDDKFSVTFSNNTSFMSPFVMPQFQTSYGTKTGAFASWGEKLAAKSGYDPKDFFQTGYNTTNSLAISASTERSQTYASASIVTAEGIIPNNEYSRYNFNISNVASWLDGRLTFTSNAQYIQVKEQNMLSSGQYYNPLIPIYLFPPGDDINKYTVYERYNVERNFKTQYWPWGDQNLSMQNPYWVINRNMFETTKNRFILGASLKFDITDWLDISGRARIDSNKTVADQKNHASTNGLFAGEYGRYYHDLYNTQQIYGDVMANFHKDFSDGLFSLNAALGASIEDMKYNTTMVGGDLAGVANLFTMGNLDPNKELYEEHYNDQTQSIFATVQLGYKRMLFLDVTARNDWASQLAGTNKMSMFYPSVGLSGVLTDIIGLDSKVLSFWKLRASYSEVGNTPMRFLPIPTYPVSGGNPQTVTYLTSDNFKPERTKSWEIGTDIRLWQNKLNITATYYSARTYNQVFNPQISSSSTYNQLYVNAGRIDNHGIELAVELNQNLGPVKWTSNVVYSRNRNKIKSLLKNYKLSTGEVITQDSLTMGGASGVQIVLREGGQMGDLYVNTLRTDEHGNIDVTLTGSAVTPEYNKWVYAGNSNPSYTLSWRNSFNWKGINLGFMFNARVGGVGVSLTQATMDHFGVSKTTGDARDKGGALVNGVRIPAEAYYTTVGGNGTNSIGANYVYSMTNVRLGELTLGYDIPVQKWCRWIKGLNISFVGRNLWMLYNKAPFDPEQVAGSGTYASGIEYFQQPSLRNLGFAVKVKF